MKLEDLPSMTIESIERNADGAVVRGHFDRIDGVGGSGWFRVSSQHFFVASLEQIDPSSGGVAVSLTREEDDGLSIGQRLPWFDGRWPAPVVQAIVDESYGWKPVVFKASTAVHFQLGNKRGWGKKGTPLINGEVVVRHEPGGWDHEHCSVCDDRIDTEKPQAYTTADGRWWLCAECYDRYARTQDVSFQLGA
jgi:hypothetical protein